MTTKIYYIYFANNNSIKIVTKWFANKTRFHLVCPLDLCLPINAEMCWLLWSVFRYIC